MKAKMDLKAYLSKLNLPFALCSLTFCFILAQALLFLIHYHMHEVVDALVNTAILKQLSQPVILLPLLYFFSAQILCYFIFIVWAWFVSVSVTQLFNLSRAFSYVFGLAIWMAGVLLLLFYNLSHFPNSFFAELMQPYLFSHSSMICMASSLVLMLLTLCAFLNVVMHKTHRYTAMFLAMMAGFFVLAAMHEEYYASQKFKFSTIQTHSAPNVILIGLDSLRPDFIRLKGGVAHTPNIDHFFRQSVVFNHAYTPLARTFPAWLSLLTGRYPRHHGARNNLAQVSPKAVHETLASQLRAAGYETIYASDEKRFSNITHAMGFDKLVGPPMGVTDFLIGGLGDFPLVNFLTSTPIGKWLFPHVYANRAAAISYQPQHFNWLLNRALINRSDKPIFLAMHLCLSHWPYSWAQHHIRDLTLQAQYAQSVEAVDKQLGEILRILAHQGLLKNAWVVLLSDHGTTLGLPGDRMTALDNYQGDIHKLKWLPTVLTANQKYSFETDFGHGGSVLSLKQHHILFAMKSFGERLAPRVIDDGVSIIDIAPTLLSLLKKPPLTMADGVSLEALLFSDKHKAHPRPIYFETGDSMSELETDHIDAHKVVKKRLSYYDIVPATGLMHLSLKAEQSVQMNKQLAVLYGDWLVARFPAAKYQYLMKNSLGHLLLKSDTYKPFFVVANVKTGEWSIGFGSTFARQAPLNALLQALHQFYREEI